ncbi:MAG: PilZ domain-containing protein [Oligoflexia bacterium]|nr:PilZ domain-containing protein [Oligoflexia bacterium]
MTSINNKKLFPLSDRISIIDILTSVQKDKESIFIVKVENNIKKMLKVSIQSYKKDYSNDIKSIFLSLKIDAENKNSIENIKKNDKYIFIYIPNKKIMFQSQLLETHKNKNLLLLNIQLPLTIHVLDKRKYVRLSASETDHNIIVQFNKKYEKMERTFSRHFELPCFDISIGGISFIIEQEHTNLFHVDDLIDKLSIRIDYNKDIVVQGKIINCCQIKPNKINKLTRSAYKIGICFNQIPSTDQEWLNSFINVVKNIK